jgi:hypothetical protein
LSVPGKRIPRQRSTPRQRKLLKSDRVQSTTMPFMPIVMFGAMILGAILWWFTNHYTVSLQSPVQIHLQWPVVVAERIISTDADEARADQHGHRLSAWQQYTCRKFGSDCRVALAIQRAENPQGKCEIYHYNSDGTLDWGYFQINTVHLERPGLNLRDLLDCKANIDFAFQLYQEKHGFTPWSTFKDGKYLQFLKSQ